jgi:hypothetical protein
MLTRAGRDGVSMKIELPMRHRRVVAGVLFVVALVAGAWSSTVVGDEHPEMWGVVLGAAVGLAVALGVLRERRTPRPPTGSLLL